LRAYTNGFIEIWKQILQKKTQFPTLAYINVPLIFYQKIHLLCMRRLATNLCAGHKRNCCSKQAIIFSKGYPCTIL